MKLKLPAFWQAVVVLVAAWLVFSWAFPPVMPRSMLITYLIIVTIGLLLYFSSEDERWREFKRPIVATLCDDEKRLVRWAMLALLTAISGYAVYQGVKPSRETPPELRQVHPAPPGSLSVYGKTYDLATLENPVRLQVLKQLQGDPDGAWKAYREAVSAGALVYFRNCIYCHGDLLTGRGHFAKGLDPLPTNFRDVGTIAQLQESFLFWRITTGGPGLPSGGMPWKSAMPVWHEMLKEEEVWNVITFLYDRVEQVPRMWDAAVSKAVTGMKDRIVAERAKMGSEELYQMHCAVCHGEKGRGDGPAADFLMPKPRDFTGGLWKFKTSPGGLPPRDEDLIRTIKAGLVGTSMPAWTDVLTDRQIAGLIEVIKRFDTSATWAPKDAPKEAFDSDGRYIKGPLRVVADREPLDKQVSYSKESVERGKKLFDENCRKCHGHAGRGNITSGKLLEDDWGQRIWPRDLTQPWTWRNTEASLADGEGGSGDSRRDETIRNIYTRLSIGIRGTPMPAHRATDPGEKDAINLEGRWDVANYAYSLREGAVWPGERSVIEGVELAGDLPDKIDDASWNRAPASTFRLVPNVVKGERLFTPLNDAITVRVLYNAREIAFLLDIDDRTESRPGGPVLSQLPNRNEKIYPDAVALQFPKEGAFKTAPVDKPLYRHGDAAHPTTIWYWNAGSVEPPVEPVALLFDATGPDAKLAKRESHSDYAARGEWQDGRWRVIMKRPRGVASEGADKTGEKSTATPDLVFRKGQYIPVSFANWDGNNGEFGSKHTLTPWFWLLLPTETNYVLVYGASLGSALAVLLVGLLVVRTARRRSPDGSSGN